MDFVPTTAAPQPAQPIALTTTPSTSGPTALVLIPQHSTNTTTSTTTTSTTVNQAKVSTITTTKITTPPSSTTTSASIPNPIPTSIASNPITATVIGSTPTAHIPIGVATATITSPATTTSIAALQSTPIQIQAPIASHLPNVTPIPVTAHQQSATTVIQPALNRPPTTIPVVQLATTLTAAPINATNTTINTTTTTTIAAVPISQIKETTTSKYTCCLLERGVRCERAAGNASFNARIQKVVSTKKMDYALDPNVRHAYICDQHKAIITAAKKTTIARENKSNARNYTANNNDTNTLNPQQNSNFNDLSTRHSLQQPVNLEMTNNQNRSTNKHANALNHSIPSGARIAYTHYPGPHSNQYPLEMVAASGYENVGGGDTLPTTNNGPDVDLQQLQVNTLRRYKRHFRVQTRPGLNKVQLAECLKSHFKTLPIIEKEAITYFVYIVKCSRNKLDHNPKAD